MRTVLSDLRYGIRRLLKSPGFAVIAILALGLGIGANSAIFSLVDRVLIRALPYTDPHQLSAQYTCARQLRGLEKAEPSLHRHGRGPRHGHQPHRGRRA